MEKKKIKLRSKLIISFLLMALFIVGIMFIASNVLLNNAFRKYVHMNHIELGETISSNLSKQYTNGEWNYAGVESVCSIAERQGILIEVYDLSGNIVNASKAHHHSNDYTSISSVSQTDTNYTIESFDIFKDSKPIGYVSLLYDDPEFYSEQDKAYLNTLNGITLGTAAISLVAAIIIGSYLAFQFVRPIDNVTKKIKEMSAGNYGNIINIDTDTKEISVLIDTFNNLSNNLSNQYLLRKRMTTDLSHELRTPLALLQSHIEAMIDGIWEPTVLRLESLNNEITRLNGLVGDIEKLNELDTENFQMEKSLFNIKELIGQICTHFEKKFADKDMILKLKIEDIKIYADKDKIDQIIINLLSNALKYSENGATVEIECVKNENLFTISVKDTGIGISDGDQENVFERLYRVDKARNSATGGRGIGLTIVKSIAEAHNGRVKIESQLGVGTKIIVELPQ